MGDSIAEIGKDKKDKVDQYQGNLGYAANLGVSAPQQGGVGTVDNQQGVSAVSSSATQFNTQDSVDLKGKEGAESEAQAYSLKTLQQGFSSEQTGSDSQVSSIDEADTSQNADDINTSQDDGNENNTSEVSGDNKDNENVSPDSKVNENEESQDTQKNNEDEQRKRM